MASSRSRIDATQRSCPASAASPETRTTGTCSPGYPHADRAVIAAGGRNCLPCVAAAPGSAPAAQW